MPELKEDETELQRAMLEYDPQQQASLFNQLNTTTPNTNEQQIIFNQIMDSINNKRTSLFSFKEWEVVVKRPWPKKYLQLQEVETFYV